MGAVSLTGEQYEQLLAAVLHAFNYNSLERCVRFRLNKHLDHLVTVQTPTGTTMATGPVDLRPDNAHDACDMLRLCATFVDSALPEAADVAGELAPGRARPSRSARRH